MNTNNNKKSLVALHLVAATMLWFSTIPTAWADATPAAPPANSPFQTCKASLSPAPTPGQKLTKEQWQQVKACVKTAKTAAKQECEATLNPAPTPGQKLTKDQRKEVRACLKTKGFRHHRKHHGEEEDSAT